MPETQLYMKGKAIWRLWAKALGEKTGNTDHEANIVALIRSVIVGLSIITNIIIALGVFRHWND